MVSVMPDAALPELVESLRDLELQFLTPTQSGEVSVDSALKFTAKVGSPIPRPEFYLDRE
jgi:hypothetical protein